MKRRWILPLLLTGLATTGCGRIEEAALSVPDKVSAAYPLSPEATLTRERLNALLADDSASQESMRTRIDQRMTLRALNCSKDHQIGRLDSLASVRGLGLPLACFQAQDAELARLFAVRGVGVLLARPPLRPAELPGPAAPLPSEEGSSAVSVAVARDAGVAALMDATGTVKVVDLTGSKLIAPMPRTQRWARMSLSPNGRVLALASASGGGLSFLEAETGRVLWATDTEFRTLLAWLPEVDAVAIGGGKSGVMLADGRTGEFDQHPVPARNASYATTLPGGQARLLWGTSRALTLIEHARTPQGIEATVVRPYTLASDVTSGPLIPMRDGKWVVFPTMMNIGWLDLDSGNSGTWRTHPYLRPPFTKLDEDHLLVDSYAGDVLGSQTSWSLDVRDQTIAPVDRSFPKGLILDIGGRTGFARRNHDITWFGHQVATGEPRALDRVVGEYLVEQQIRKLEASKVASEQPSSFDRPQDQAATTIPGLDGVPANADVHIVGVYEGGRDASPSRAEIHGIERARAATSRSREVRVVVRRTERPVVLVLASYESVNWIVEAGGGQLSAVLLSGYHPSTVEGVGTTSVLRIGSAYAYEADSSEYRRLRQAVARYTGSRPIRSFQGGYQEHRFIVGGS